jgi:hypothetical protein
MDGKTLIEIVGRNTKKKPKPTSNVIMCNYYSQIKLKFPLFTWLLVSNWKISRNKLRTPKTSMSNTSLDRYLHGSQTPVIRTERTPKRSVVTSAPPPKRISSCIDFSMDILNQSLESSQSEPKDQWFCLKKIENDSWLCSNRHDVMAVNFTRLYEMILYSRLANEHVIPSRTVNNPMLIDKKYTEKQ